MANQYAVLAGQAVIAVGWPALREGSAVVALVGAMNGSPIHVQQVADTDKEAEMDPIIFSARGSGADTVLINWRALDGAKGGNITVFYTGIPVL